MSTLTNITYLPIIPHLQSCASQQSQPKYIATLHVQTHRRSRRQHCNLPQTTSVPRAQSAFPPNTQKVESEGQFHTKDIVTSAEHSTRPQSNAQAFYSPAPAQPLPTFGSHSLEWRFYPGNLLASCIRFGLPPAPGVSEPGSFDSRMRMAVEIMLASPSQVQPTPRS